MTQEDFNKMNDWIANQVNPQKLTPLEEAQINLYIFSALLYDGDCILISRKQPN